MIIVDVKDTASLDRALKMFKKKIEKTKVIHQLRERQFFVKKSVKRRAQILKASYKQRMLDN